MCNVRDENVSLNDLNNLWLCLFRWFEYLRMGHLGDLLVENDVDGKTLMTLNEEDLVELGVKSVRS